MAVVVRAEASEPLLGSVRPHAPAQHGTYDASMSSCASCASRTRYTALASPDDPPTTDPLTTHQQGVCVGRAAVAARARQHITPRRGCAPTQSRRAMGGSSSAFCASEPSSPMVSIVRLLCTIRNVLMLPSTRASSITAIACSPPNASAFRLLYGVGAALRYLCNCRTAPTETLSCRRHGRHDQHIYAPDHLVSFSWHSIGFRKSTGYIDPCRTHQ